MKFESVELYNFKVFTGRQLFNFCHGLPGLHFITGKNLVDKNLDANGVGKSSLWDAISWVLYGRTLRGARASNVCSWQVGSGCEVTLKLVVDDKSNVIFRSWSPNKLTLNDEV